MIKNWDDRCCSAHFCFFYVKGRHSIRQPTLFSLFKIPPLCFILIVPVLTDFSLLFLSTKLSYTALSDSHYLHVNVVGTVHPHTVFLLFATCCTALCCAHCQVVFSEINVMHCQWAHFSLYRLGWWRVSEWPVFSKLNFLCWRLSRTRRLYSAGITKQQPACVWQLESIPTSFIQILQTLGVDRLGNQCPQA